MPWGIRPLAAAGGGRQGVESMRPHRKGTGEQASGIGSGGRTSARQARFGAETLVPASTLTIIAGTATGLPERAPCTEPEQYRTGDHVVLLRFYSLKPLKGNPLRREHRETARVAAGACGRKVDSGKGYRQGYGSVC